MFKKRKNSKKKGSPCLKNAQKNRQKGSPTLKNGDFFFNPPPHEDYTVGCWRPFCFFKKPRASLHFSSRHVCHAQQWLVQSSDEQAWSEESEGGPAARVQTDRITSRRISCRARDKGTARAFSPRNAWPSACLCPDGRQLLSALCCLHFKESGLQEACGNDP